VGSRRLLAVPNITAHPSASVLMYNGPLLCAFHVAIKGGLNCFFSDSLHLIPTKRSIKVTEQILNICINYAKLVNLPTGFLFGMTPAGLCRRAVSVRPSVCPSATFMHCIEKSKHVLKLFHVLVATPF